MENKQLKRRMKAMEEERLKREKEAAQKIADANTKSISAAHSTCNVP